MEATENNIDTKTAKKQNHLYFVPKDRVPITLPKDPNSKGDTSMRIFIPISVNQDSADVKPTYNYALDKRVLILKFKIKCDVIGNNKRIEFLCLKVKGVYHNDGPRMIVIKTKIKHKSPPPTDITLSKYPEWDKPVLTYEFDNGKVYINNPAFSKSTIDEAREEVKPDPSLTLNSEENDSCTIPPKD